MRLYFISISERIILWLRKRTWVEIIVHEARANTTVILNVIWRYEITNTQTCYLYAPSREKKTSGLVGLNSASSTITSYHFIFWSNTLSALDRHEFTEESCIIMGNIPTHRVPTIRKLIKINGITSSFFHFLSSKLSQTE